MTLKTPMNYIKIGVLLNKWRVNKVFSQNTRFAFLAIERSVDEYKTR